MLTRENAVISISVLAALVVAVAVTQYTTLPWWAVMAVVVVLGVVVPTAINEHARRGRDAG